jgi:hypothetical protein
VIRLVFEFLLLKKVVEKGELRFSYLAFSISYLFYPFYVIIFAFSSQFLKTGWKNRSL